MTRRMSLACALTALLLGACQQTLVLDDLSPEAGSSGTGGSGVGPSDASSDARCFGTQSQMVSFVPETPQVVIALDRSSTMTETLFGPPDTEFSAAATGLSAEVSSYAPSGQHNGRRAISFAYLDFPDDAKDCSGGPSCCSTDVVSTNSYTAFQDATSAGDGVQSANRPIFAALSRAHDYYDFGPGSMTTGQRYVLLVTDGAPGGCSSGSPPADCQDAVGEITALSDDLDVITVVVEVGSQLSTACLEDLAAAQGTPPPWYIDASLYNDATTPNYLASVLGTVANGIAGGACRLTLAYTPSSPDQLSVTYNNGAVLPAGNNGWTYESDAGTPYVVLHGTACQSFINGQSFDLQIYDGCALDHPAQNP